jgi:hypothetical protein
MPNAAPQLLPEAGAERTLEAVSCRRLFGWGCLEGLGVGYPSPRDADPTGVRMAARSMSLRSSPVPVYWITLVAWNRSGAGMVRLSALAVLRLITNSNVSGRSTGRSAGCAPFKILSTYVAARR